MGTMTVKERNKHIADEIAKKKRQEVFNAINSLVFLAEKKITNEKIREYTNNISLITIAKYRKEYNEKYKTNV